MTNQPRDEKWVEQEATALIAMAKHLAPEAEGLDLTDREFTLEEMSMLRSHLSTQRSNIDVVNRALADAWEQDHKYEEYNDGTNTWKLGKTKGKAMHDEEAFYEWVATLDAARIKKLFSWRNVKVGGFNPDERKLHLDESEWTDRYTLGSKPNDMKG